MNHFRKTSIILVLVSSAIIFTLTGCSNTDKEGKIIENTSNTETSNIAVTTNNTEAASNTESTSISQPSSNEVSSSEAAGSKNNSNGISTGEEHLIAFIKTIDKENKTITVDEVEWLTVADKDKLAAIGVNSEDLPNDYYIYNEEETLTVYSYDDKLKVDILDGVNSVTASVDTFEERLKQYNLLCNIKLKDNVIMEISEQYRP